MPSATRVFVSRIVVAPAPRRGGHTPTPDESREAVSRQLPALFQLIRLGSRQPRPLRTVPALISNLPSLRISLLIQRRCRVACASPQAPCDRLGLGWQPGPDVLLFAVKSMARPTARPIALTVTVGVQVAQVPELQQLLYAPRHVGHSGQSRPTHLHARWLRSP